jgi:S1-C subfamily serine protease/Tfp pilus assembly protein PilF
MMAASPDHPSHQSSESERVHPIVWAAVGGGIVAVGALIVGFMFSKNDGGSQSGAGSSPTAFAPIPAETFQASNSISVKEANANNPPSELKLDELFRRCSPAVVGITVKNESGRPIFSGSGFVIGRHEVVPKYVEVVTNFHVIRSAVDAEVEFENGEKRPVWWVLSESETNDIALLGVKSPDKMPPSLTFSLDLPEVGKNVFAIGSPEGFKNTLSPGIAQGLRELDKSGIEYLQFSAPISHGSSGGPLLNARGIVVGVTTLILKSGQNLNFSVPSKAVQETLSERESREVWRGASIEREYKEAFERLKKALEMQGCPQSDPAIQFASAAGLQDDSTTTERLKRAKAARDSIPDEFKFLIDLEIGETYSAAATLKNIENGLSPERMRGYEEYSRAISSLDSAARLKPTFARTWSSLSNLYWRAGEFDKAMKAADRAVSLAPRCAYTYSERGRCYKELGQLASAIDDFQEAISLQPEDYHSYQELGSAYRETGDLPEAIESLETALEIESREKPHQAEEWTAREQLGEMYSEVRNYRKALANFEIAAQGFSAIDGKVAPFIQLQIDTCKKKLAEQ